MKGRYHFTVRSKKTLFEFTIKRNITIIKGDSASGKTTLLRMLYEYLLNGRQSGFSVSAEANYYVYMRKEIGRSWQDALYPLKNTIIFLEENNDFVFGQEFADFVVHSGNYFVIVNRAPLKMLPYSVREIYEIVTLQNRDSMKETYHEFRELYSNYPEAVNNKLERIVTEDSNSGYEFYSKLFCNSQVESAGGNGNVVKQLDKFPHLDTLVIVDGAAFGAMAEDCIEYAAQKKNRRISVWMPESFEYILLRAGIFQSERLNLILEQPWEYIDSEKYPSWERYFTDLLVEISDSNWKYTKANLNAFYLQDKNVKKVIHQLPGGIKERMLLLWFKI